MNNSECKGGFLHDYQIVKTYEHGVIERCTRCKQQQYFRNNVPNHIYLSYHLRSMIQPKDPRFNHEYKNA